MVLANLEPLWLVVRGALVLKPGEEAPWVRSPDLARHFAIRGLGHHGAARLLHLEAPGLVDLGKGEVVG